MIAYLKLIRPEQWIKNGFVAVPLFLTPQLWSLEVGSLVITGMVSFSLIASATYILNDIIDRNADRLHERKKLRPIAARKISVFSASLLMGLCLSLGLGVAFLLSAPFLKIALGYVFLQVCYCFILKNYAIIDVLSISLGFIFRVAAGASLVAVPFTTWIVIATGLLALFQALAKRRDDLCLELDDVQTLSQKGEAVLVADILPLGNVPGVNKIPFIKLDITKKETVEKLPIEPDDIVYHLAARQYHEDVPTKDRLSWFCEVNVNGTENILDHMNTSGCRSLVYLSTDMVYGQPMQIPLPSDHPQYPLGEYGESKKRSEVLCNASRANGMDITILRPRLIIGPGRLGILAKLFWLIDHNLPVPLIGNGANVYQMISVFDVVDAIMKACEKSLPNRDYNLGSENPPPVRDLLRKLIKVVGSKSILIPTPGTLMKKVLGVFDALNMPLLYREQYGIADVNYVVDISATKKELGWTPQFSDEDMIHQAFEIYKTSI